MCVFVCVRTRVCVVTQLTGMLFLPAGALNRAWVAVWFVAFTRGGGGLDRQLCLDLALFVPLSVGECACMTQKHTHTQSHAHRQQTCLCVPLATITTAAAMGAGLQLDVSGKNNLT